MPDSTAVDAPSTQFERRLLRQGYARPAGVDEVGRGSLAGPVVAAAVILPLHDSRLQRRLRGVRDSKLLTAERRQELCETILDCALAIGIGWVSHRMVDRAGIASANRQAMLRAVAGLPLQPDALLIDYVSLPECGLPQLSITGGDRLSLSVAAASIVAKVHRDLWMLRCCDRFPQFEFGRHKGYGTQSHRDALAAHGPSRIHRLSFAPVGGQ